MRRCPRRFSLFVRHRARAAVIAWVAALLLVAACSGGAAPTNPPTGPGSAPSVPRPTLPPVELGKIPTADPAVHVFLWGNPRTTQRDLNLARDAGFTWVKQRFEWRNVEKNGKGQFEWQEPDRVMQAIGDSGLRVIARLDNQPRWASSKITFPASGPPDNQKDWTDYVTALAARYKGKIQAYEIWNEPNLAREWGGQKPDPAAYTALLKASYQAIKAVDPQALVISAGMSPTTESSDNAMRDMDFYRGMYAAGAKGSFDLLGAHMPGFKGDPCQDPAQVAADPSLTNPGDPSPTELKRVYAFRHVEDVRALMVEQGDGDKQIAVLEMGWTTDPRPGSPYLWHAVSEDQQAKYLVAGFQCAREKMSPWLAFTTVIYIPDPQWTPSQEQYWWSITNPDGSPRPAYTALKELLTK
ncbi:MAG: cellulase family glycosylhydrolase [Chloroflexi bacterium]|nr:cellulase family glycosylhydrolase [Chloroflexota bacterium]